MWASEVTWASDFSHDLAQNASLESGAHPNRFALEPNLGSEEEPKTLGLPAPSVQANQGISSERLLSQADTDHLPPPGPRPLIGVIGIFLCGNCIWSPLSIGGKAGK